MELGLTPFSQWRHGIDCQVSCLGTRYSCVCLFKTHTPVPMTRLAKRQQGGGHNGVSCALRLLHEGIRFGIEASGADATLQGRSHSKRARRSRLHRKYGLLFRKQQVCGSPARQKFRLRLTRLFQVLDAVMNGLGWFA